MRKHHESFTCNLIYNFIIIKEIIGKKKRYIKDRYIKDRF